MSLKDFLNREPLQASLTNSYGEVKSLGKAHKIRRHRDSYSLRYAVENDIHVSPFTWFVLHGKSLIFSVSEILPINLEGSRFIEFELTGL